MAETTKTVEILVTLRDQVTSKIKELGKVFDNLRTKGTPLNKEFVAIKDSIGSIAWTAFTRSALTAATALGIVRKAVFSLYGALAGVGIALTAKSFLDVAASFEEMEAQLDVLTRGRGVETLRRLHEMALKMNVSTKETTEAYKLMLTTGLEPTVEKMRTLLNVANVFEGSMPHIISVFSQMSEVGKLSNLNINQLKKFGVHVKDYLYDAFKMSVDEVQQAGIPIGKIIDALWKGLDAEYSGAAQKASRSWRGLWNNFVQIFEEMQLKIMRAGVFNELKMVMEKVNEVFGKWLDTNASLIAQNIPRYIKRGEEAITKIYEVINKIIDVYNKIPSEIVSIAGYGLIGRILLGGSGGMLLGMAAGMMAEAVKDPLDIMKASMEELKREEDNLTRNIGTNVRGRVKYIDVWYDRLDQVRKRITQLSDTEKKVEDDRRVSREKLLRQEKGRTGKLREGDLLYKGEGVPPETVPMKARLEAELVAIKDAGDKQLSLTDYLYEQGIRKVQDHYDKKMKLLENNARDEIAILNKIRSTQQSPVEGFATEQRISAVRRKLEKDKEDLERKKTADISKEDEIRVKRAIETGQELNEIELQNLDDLYRDKEVKDAAYYNKRWDIIVSAFRDEIALLEERKRTASNKEDEIIETEILSKRIEVYKKLTETARSYFDELKRRDELRLGQRGQMLDAFTSNVEDFKKVESEWWQYRSEQLARQYEEFSKFNENEELRAKWLAQQKMNLLDEYNQKSSLVYQNLRNWTDATADSMGQSFSTLFFDIAEGRYNTLREIGTDALKTLQKITADVLGQMMTSLLKAQFDKLIKSFISTTDAAKGNLALIDQEIEKVAALTKKYIALAAAKTLAGVISGVGYAGAGTRGVTPSADTRWVTWHAEGGEVPGSSPHPKADNVLTRLTAGEWVHPVDTVKYYGGQVMEAIRTKMIPREFFTGFRIPSIPPIPRTRFGYATGGSVSGGGNVKVEMINESGVPMEATQSDVEFRGDEMVVKVFIDSLKRNVGGSREQMKRILG